MTKVGLFLCLLLMTSAFLVSDTVLAVAQPGGGAGIVNPLAGGGINSAADLVIAFTRWLLGLAAVLALLALVVGGIRMILAFGNDSKLGEAKQVMTWAVIGLIVVLVSYGVIYAVTDILGIS